MLLALVAETCCVVALGAALGLAAAALALFGTVATVLPACGAPEARAAGMSRPSARPAESRKPPSRRAHTTGPDDRRDTRPLITTDNKKALVSDLGLRHGGVARFARRDRRRPAACLLGTARGRTTVSGPARRRGRISRHYSGDWIPRNSAHAFNRAAFVLNEGYKDGWPGGRP